MAARSTSTRPSSVGPERSAPDRRFLVGAFLLGLGLGGFIDGILLHQILQWHHMLTDAGRHSSFPDTDVRSLEQNTRWDGLFHLSAWTLTTGGLFVLWRSATDGHLGRTRSLIGLLFAGWGTFNLVEGIVDHHLLTIHHVRDDVADPLVWDLGFLALGAALVAVGVLLHRSARATSDVR